ncbi:hypothetical protein KFL_005310030 [Klebsormidium nitens]|uniref:Fido domain-containing protein n=1 Tax=Klebsormidium nitens TaxID=105231 RepID=A0A1Y1IK46_KLENI|nr:hypothetical protein KFL_005310030 [Klebsormidium nitens]|eukprot:GAQ89511.1 hypothetical protein KFL_005310030 [Klebsormidium nitens]
MVHAEEVNAPAMERADMRQNPESTVEDAAAIEKLDGDHLFKNMLDVAPQTQVEYVSSNYARLPWELEDPDIVFERTALYIASLKDILDGSTAARMGAEHSVWAATCSIYFSNLIEGAGLSLSDTHKLCVKILKGEPVGLEENRSNSRQSRTEVLQHAEAFRYLYTEMVTEGKPLDFLILQETHRILMTDMVREDGKKVGAGIFRTEPCNAGQHQFPFPAAIVGSLRWLLHQYNWREHEQDSDPFELAAWLSYEFVAIHPFDDGNGRMSRLLMNMVLLSRGLAFPVALGFSSGHRQAKQQYLQCIRNAQARQGNTNRLATIILYAYQSVVGSFFENVRLVAPDELPDRLSSISKLTAQPR